MLQRLRRGEPFDTTQGRQIRDFIHIDDVGRALAGLTGADLAGAVNVGSGEGVALREVALTLAGGLGADAALLRFGALPERPGDPARLVADIGRLRAGLGFSPAVGWAEGLGRLAAGGAA